MLQACLFSGILAAALPCWTRSLGGEVLKQIKTPPVLLQKACDTLDSRAELADFPLSSAISVHWLADSDRGFKPKKAAI